MSGFAEPQRRSFSTGIALAAAVPCAWDIVGHRSTATFQGMQFHFLGDDGTRVSRLCLGMMSFGSPAWQAWVLDESAAITMVRTALDLGINTFDTADAYSNGLSE